MKYCSTCGAQIPADAKVCPVCGAALAPAAAPTTSAATYNFNIPSLICAAIALLLFFVAPVVDNFVKVTYFDNFKNMLSNLDIVFENFAYTAGDLIMTLAATIAVILCVVFSFTNNKTAAIKSATFGIIGILGGYVLGLFLLGNELNVPFGDIFSGIFEGLGEFAYGFWLMLVAFVGVIVSNKKAA